MGSEKSSLRSKIRLEKKLSFTFQSLFYWYQKWLVLKINISQGGVGSEWENAQKVSRIIWMAPYHSFSNIPGLTSLISDLDYVIWWREMKKKILVDVIFTFARGFWEIFLKRMPCHKFCRCNFCLHGKSACGPIALQNLIEHRKLGICCSECGTESRIKRIWCIYHQGLRLFLPSLSRLLWSAGIVSSNCKNDSVIVFLSFQTSKNSNEFLSELVFCVFVFANI